MAVAVIQAAFVAGELSPSLYGRVDLSKYHVGASTIRNMFVQYRGGVSSRAGTLFVGPSKTPVSGGHPPRLIKFQFSLTQGYALEFGDKYMRVVSEGAYITEASKNITGITQANPGVVSVTSHGYSAGDWVYINGVAGMTEVNGKTYLVGTTASGTFQLKSDLTGGNVNTSAYTTYSSGGTVARVMTVTTPYAIADLVDLKYAQSADTMSLVHPSYPPYDLTRTGTASWSMTATTFTASITAPATISASASATTASLQTAYQYVVTAVSNTTKEESIASPIATVTNSVDIAVTAGTITVNWSAVSGADSYNVYKAPAAYNTSIPTGVLFGYCGTALSTSFVDTNIVQDFSFVPPTHQNPFASSGSYPSCVAYFQQRRVYANTNNNPDTYYMSQPGAYKNFDTRIPTTDADAITGTPWAQQVNGIQALVPMQNGLIVLTGNGAWLVSGGGNNAAITPASQNAQAQAYNGCHDHITPIPINYDVLFVQAKGSIVRDLSYSFYINIFTGTDMTVLSSHLFEGHQLVDWAWAEEPFKLLWAVRDDGMLLCLTYLKEQDVYAWTRHDTDGLFQTVCSVTEPPVDALYCVVKRYINGAWYYFIERMDDRLWLDVEDAWCVDAGLSYGQTTPAATLTPAAATGTNNITSVLLIDGGTNYTAPVLSAQDLTGTGATFSATVTGGVITAVSVSASGSKYIHPIIRVTDATGSGAVIQPVVTNIVNFDASTASFSASNVGDVLRVDQGIAVITSYVSATRVAANIIQPLTVVIPNGPENQPVPAVAGNWTISRPTTTVSGLDHLVGKTVAILADGNVMDPQVVASDGSITLAHSASAITVGLPFIAQLQSLYLDIPGAPGTIQGKRKNIYAVTVRVDKSRGLSVGTNQVDAATTPSGSEEEWSHMIEVKDRGAAVSAGAAVPLFTGDYRVNVMADWDKHGQVAVQQKYPLPLNLLSIMPEVVVGDSNDAE